MRSQRGVTMTALVVTLVIMIILTTMLIYVKINNGEVTKEKMIEVDVKQVQDSVNNYYMKNYAVPVIYENGEKKVLDINEVITILGDKRYSEDEDIYYLLDITLLNNITLSSRTQNGKFIINEITYTVYYVGNDF